ncbi:hypothetical protein LTR05_006338 [Lithohypha guttulata]|uniref:RING-type domain-containing protein n=1 Tax=Lithohypha guttulata TaxID=1690604 RepID=A0AAN7SYJ9_9EURO|nr:hypothetical protein LTR05_006338 [Lithohypha guttulata]
MADDNVVSLSDVDDVSDGETMIIGLESMEQDIAKLQESHRRYRNRMKQKNAKLKESKEKHERDYHHELCRREKENESWRRKFTEKCEDMKALKREIADLRGRMKHLRVELKAKTRQLERMDHLICDICYDREKCLVTRCGHGFCASCLPHVFDIAAEEAMLDDDGDGVSVVGEANCPTCRERLNQKDDVWPIFLTESVG